MPSPTQNPTKPFPLLGWYLRNGVKNASERDLPELERAELSCERWTWGCGAFVVLGVGFEIVLAWANQPYGTPWEHWGPVGANFLVTAGVAGEVIFSRMGFVRSRKIQEISNDRADKAQRETELIKERTSWRQFDIPTLKALGDALEKIPPATVQFAYVMGDTEARNLADDFAAVFRHHEWNVGFAANLYLEETRYGLWIAANLASPEARSLSVEVERAFKAAGISVKHGQMPAPVHRQIFPSSPALMPPPIVAVYVGPKYMLHPEWIANEATTRPNTSVQAPREPNI